MIKPLHARWLGIPRFNNANRLTEIGFIMKWWPPVYRHIMQFAVAVCLLCSVHAAAAVPGAPTIGAISVGDGAVSVSFTAPSDNGGSAITGYVVTVENDGRTVTGISTPILVNGLTNGTSYRFNVAASNADGTGPVSAWSMAVRPFFRPIITASNVTLSGGTGINGVRASSRACCAQPQMMRMARTTRFVSWEPKAC